MSYSLLRHGIVGDTSLSVGTAHQRIHAFMYVVSACELHVWENVTRIISHNESCVYL